MSRNVNILGRGYQVSLGQDACCLENNLLTIVMTLLGFLTVTELILNVLTTKKNVIMTTEDDGYAN